MTDSPITAPLTYPGTRPPGPAVLVLGQQIVRLQDGPGGWVASPPSGPEPLDSVLAKAGAAPMAARIPVLAVGSNAAPAQLMRKFAAAGARAAVPVTSVRVHGITVGVSAHVSVPGYLPATPVPDPSAVSALHITWLGAAELAVMDATELNYTRGALAATHTVQLPSGQRVTGGQIYVSRWGYLTSPAGTPLELAPQPELIRQLLAHVPGLSALAGASPAEWVTRTRDPQARERIKGVLRAAGLVREALGITAQSCSSG